MEYEVGFYDYPRRDRDYKRYGSAKNAVLRAAKKIFGATEDEVVFYPFEVDPSRTTETQMVRLDFKILRNWNRDFATITRPTAEADAE